MSEKFYPFDEAKALNYINQSPLRTQFFKDSDTLICKDLADGNVNLVFRVSSNEDPSRSIIVKQALPYARRYPDFKMPLDRARIEYEVLIGYDKIVPSLSPKVYNFDSELYVNLMEDLRDLHIMREGIMKGTFYPTFADDIGTFLAKNLIHTSDFVLDSAKKKEKVINFSNPVLTKVTEDLIYTFPYIQHQTNRFPKQLEKSIAKIYETAAIKLQATKCKFEFMTKAESLLHGDLHTGSIMVKPGVTKVMDPEFAFYGPMAFDIAVVLGNIAMAYFSAPAHLDSSLVKGYQNYLSETYVKIWHSFTENFRKEFETFANSEWKDQSYLENFLAEIETSVIRHSACEMFRRTIGMAHIAELDNISDEDLLSKVSLDIISAAEDLLVGSRTTIEKASKIF